MSSFNEEQDAKKIIKFIIKRVFLSGLRDICCFIYLLFLNVLLKNKKLRYKVKNKNIGVFP